MDYLPVYEGEDSDDGTVKLSPGKLQKTGVRSEPVERRMLSAPLHAPGIVQLDERRVSVVALRFEGFIDSIENLTTGEHVHKGQTLMRVSGPSLASAAAEYLIALKAGVGWLRRVAGRQGRETAARKYRRAGDDHRIHRANARNPAVRPMASAAGWRNRRTRRGQRHARRARRCVVPHRRS